MSSNVPNEIARRVLAFWNPRASATVRRRRCIWKQFFNKEGPRA